MRPDPTQHPSHPRSALADLERALHHLRAALDAADDALDHVLNRRIDPVCMDHSVWLGPPKLTADGASD